MHLGFKNHQNASAVFFRAWHPYCIFESHLQPMAPFKFRSKRLGFRLWSDQDITPFVRLNADPEVMEFFPSTLSREQTVAMMDRINRQHAEHGYGLYAVEELNSGEFVGFIGLSIPTFESWFTPCVEIGWRLRKDVWNKGLATEGAQRCLHYAFENLRLETIYSFTAALNKRSERVMEKIGMTRVGEFDYPKVAPESPLRKHVVYKILKRSARVDVTELP